MRNRTQITEAEAGIPYFSQVAESYFARYDEQSPGGYALRERKRRVLELVNGVKGKVLDVGCGPGVMVRDILDLGCEFWGVDASPGMVAECQRRFGQVQEAHFSVADATSLEFPDNYFDVVMCMGVIDRIQAFESAIREMARIVKHNGTILISFPNVLSPYAAWKKFVFYPAAALLRPVYFTVARRPKPPTLYSSFTKLYSAHTVDTPRSATQLMTKYNFEVTDVVYCYFNVFLSPLDELFPRSALRLTKKLERLRFGRMKWLGAGFVLKAQKRL